MDSFTRRDAIALTLAAVAQRSFSQAVSEGTAARSLSVRYYGTDTPLPREIPLQAGPVTLLFEPALAQIRYIRLGEREVIRAIYAAVRDRNWGTVAPQVSNLKVETTDSTFGLTFDVTCREGDIDFLWRGRVRGDEQGSVKFEFDGTARSTFLKNRIGFCVLHPVDGCAGRPITVTKADGAQENGRFPADISPHQPFVNIRSMRHTVTPGVDAQVDFEGDVFEMEDHRNWTDASYKTYSTPLALPFPVEVKQGSTIRQAISLRLTGTAPKVEARAREAELTLQVAGGKSTPFPELGLGIASAAATLTERETQRIRALHPAHLRVDLELGRQDWATLLTRAAREANAVGASLEVAVTLGRNPDAELERLAAAVLSHNVRVVRYLVFHSEEKSTHARWMTAARKALQKTDSRAKFASGTNAYFTELNRERPPVQESDVVCYSINPQVHAFDSRSLVETLPMQAETVRSARKFTGLLPIAVTPVTLKPRFNPNATGATAAGSGQRLPDQVDPRQMSLFGAAWTIGSLKYLAEAGASSITYYETTGWRGVMETEAGCPLPAQFRSRPGEVFPLYHVLADAGAFAGGEVLSSVSSDPLRVEGLVLRKGSRSRLLLANFTPTLQQVRVARSPFGKAVRVVMLDEHTVERAMGAPEVFRRQSGALREAAEDGLVVVSLLPYAVARIDPA